MKMMPLRYEAPKKKNIYIYEQLEMVLVEYKVRGKYQNALDKSK